MRHEPGNSFKDDGSMDLIIVLGSSAIVKGSITYIGALTRVDLCFFSNN